MKKLMHALLLLSLVFTISCVKQQAPTELEFEETRNEFDENKSKAWYEKTAYPVIAKSCANCHGDNKSQSPYFGVTNLDKSYKTLMQNNLVNLDNPKKSRIVVRPLLEGHNGCGDKCEELGNEMLAAVKEWAQKMADNADPSDIADSDDNNDDDDDDDDNDDNNNPPLPSDAYVDATKWEKTKYVVDNFCISCHSAAGSASFAPFDTNDEDALANSKFVAAGDPSNSSLYKRLKFSESDELVATMPLTTHGDNGEAYVAQFSSWVKEWINSRQPASNDPDPLPPAVADPEASTAVRLLNLRELNNTLKDIFAVTDFATNYFPPEVLDPFDTNSAKMANPLIVEAYANMAFALSSQITQEQSFKTQFLKCTPSSASDSSCMQNFIQELGKRMYRRPLIAQEVSELATTATSFATESNNFDTGMQYVVMTLLQSPNFIYKSEIGSGNDALKKLDNYQIVTRLSYLLLSTTPSKRLLDRAAGAPITSEELVTMARAILENEPKAKENVKLFHRQWFKYADPFVPDNLKPLMMQETTALVNLVLDDPFAAWTKLFTYDKTYVNQELAEHYGISGVTGQTAQWVPYQNPIRGGLFAHGSFLSYLARSDFEPSPTKRGKYIAENILCRTILPPPPGISVDITPDMDDSNTSECKVDKYKEHAQKGSGCFNCHQAMDPIGFGLENLDGLGRYRTTEPTNDDCTITGDGTVEYIGAFNGAKQLGNLVATSDELTQCAVQRYFEFGMGRSPAGKDIPQMQIVHRNFKDSGEKFEELIIEMIAHPNFIHRREE
jgi:cytochrome c553